MPGIRSHLTHRTRTMFRRTMLEVRASRRSCGVVGQRSDWVMYLADARLGREALNQSLSMHAIEQGLAKEVKEGCASR